MKMPRDKLASLFLALTLAMAPAGAMAAGSSSSSTPTDAYQEAEDLIDDEEFAKAIPLLEQSIKEKGEYADALNLLGYSYREMGQLDKAMTYYNKALSMEPQHLGANEYIGELYLEMNDLPKAEERLACSAPPAAIARVRTT
jgi:tetratricopeptide (TPR) repeat protein